MSKIKHVRLLARTVLVKNNDIEKSNDLLNRVLNSEGILQEDRRLRFFERPCLQRNRICFERGKRIYNSEMSRKMKFLMKKNRADPFPR
ncbi:small ribosomal subunit protein bS21m-like [Ruditapes philippinarum]|uniref:small ribosomal subunit protein bS21m-like n=1 Tax=Ruditapes philippinarum TaxID=129788 RepID=UPI00295B5D09|nr:small ribosomal subunit protein bS21m-like [Ruditapes philippinarum]